MRLINSKSTQIGKAQIRQIDVGSEVMSSVSSDKRSLFSWVSTVDDIVRMTIAIRAWKAFRNCPSAAFARTAYIPSFWLRFRCLCYIEILSSFGPQNDDIWEKILSCLQSLDAVTEDTTLHTQFLDYVGYGNEETWSVRTFWQMCTIEVQLALKPWISSKSLWCLQWGINLLKPGHRISKEFTAGAASSFVIFSNLICNKHWNFSVLVYWHSCRKICLRPKVG